MPKKLIPHIFFLSLLTIFTWFLFQTGLSNTFILDDIPNLRELSQLQNNTSLEKILEFIFHKTHVDSGRPVSFFSFALQATDWPNPIPFKQFNILLHLFNGILVFWLSHRLLMHSTGKSLPIIAIGITSFWLLAPIQVDTVQYVIQRMAILATTFTLLGLITYSYARTMLAYTNKAFFLLYIIFGLCLVLAVFSKENGLLLTVIIILLEFSLFQNESRPVYYKVWFSFAIILPLLLFAILVLYKFENYFLYTYRDFNVFERLWTQQDILIHYLSSILAPSTSKLTLFYDDYTISKSLLSPPTTLFFFLLNIILTLTALLTLKRWPLFGFGILFFYANHLMESTFLPLELYFEHRNYLAILGIAFSLFSGIYYINNTIKHPQIKNLIYSVPVILVLISTWVNYQQNLVWANPLYQAHKWYQSHPLSQRAHGYYGLQLNHAGLHKEAIALYQSTIENFPNDPTKPLLWLQLTCDPKVHPAPSPGKLLKKARSGKHYKESIAILNDFILAFETQRCPGVEKKYFSTIITAFLNNPSYGSSKDTLNLLIIQYRLYQLELNYRQASESLEKAMTIKQRPDIMIGLAEKYIFLKYPLKAKELINLIDNYCNKNTIKCANVRDDIKLLKKIHKNIIH